MLFLLTIIYLLSCILTHLSRNSLKLLTLVLHVFANMCARTHIRANVRICVILWLIIGAYREHEKMRSLTPSLSLYLSEWWEYVFALASVSIPTNVELYTLRLLEASFLHRGLIYILKIDRKYPTLPLPLLFTHKANEKSRLFGTWILLRWRKHFKRLS